ncbi:hypothetical protein SASPL_137981 [Salvia splendens]|uniref:Uncharacterized protein n=1 Tax=Salvia splendens TaxID=180675 RepID=A0A8X8WUD2_SALSN|nr:hypothetical protein SASPL_137981 [Salvia splendens]
MIDVSSSSSGSFDEITYVIRDATRIIVKATDGEHTMRFKFEPTSGFFELYSKVEKRFQLRTGSSSLAPIYCIDGICSMIGDALRALIIYGRTTVIQDDAYCKSRAVGWLSWARGDD